jgi:hypothetical protein
MAHAVLEFILAAVSAALVTGQARALCPEQQRIEHGESNRAVGVDVQFQRPERMRAEPSAIPHGLLHPVLQ